MTENATRPVPSAFPPTGPNLQPGEHFPATSRSAGTGSNWGDMPSVLRADGYRFFFYSDEGNPREPPHIHVVSGEKTAKFWLDPVELVNSRRLSASEIGAVHRLVTGHRDIFLEAWHAHFDA